MITRRSLIRNSAAGSLAASGLLTTPASAADSSGGGRLKQSVCRWTYSKYSLDDLCQAAQRIGLKGIDLVQAPDWPTVKKYGLVPSMVQGNGKIPDGFNRLENHDKLIGDLQELITLVASNGLPNVICFSGNRKGMPDGEGLDNCVKGLNRVKKFAEEKGVTVNLELLNSKVNHKDYMATTRRGAWDVKRVDSPRVKLLTISTTCRSWKAISSGRFVITSRILGISIRAAIRGRHELDNTQELNWRAIATAIADLGYPGLLRARIRPDCARSDQVSGTGL